MRVLVIGHVTGNQLGDSILNVLGAATKLNTKVDVLIIGKADITEIANLNCIAKIIHLSDISGEQMQSAFLAKSLAQVVKSYTHVLTAADSAGKDLLPRIAGILELSQISEVIGIISPNMFKRPMYAGNVVAEVESFEDIKLLTIRTTSFTKYTEMGVTASIEEKSGLVEINPATSFISQDIIHSDTIDLAHAKIVVTGGRSLGSKENFDDLIHTLAVKLGAAVGASRAAVEAGYAPNDCQVGQTGKVVAPALYLAVGISGAVQHIAGMKDSKTVVAINLDPNAQIFEYSDYGLVADLFEVVPQLVNALS